ncbi:MAG: hypothetical protein IMZ62_01820 [Chloroflexi bacterium]|nr:hypothetical protein [Chloroflexota bacterium]
MPPLFDSQPLSHLAIPGLPFLPLFERLLALRRDADMYFACLATLHKARLKYSKILRTQPIPTIDQVGPRGLLQYGTASARAITALLFWRKWFFDIDNRAGQETGYLFEPIIANAIGGIPVSATKSPIRRHADKGKGRQADCIRDKRAYEFKIRVTIAASGQGRWREELEFPLDCKGSGFVPVLVVLDATPNPKLAELERAYRDQDGEVYVGEDAWQHLDAVAGPTMTTFLEKYVRAPIQSLLAEVPACLPEFVARMEDDSIILVVGGETLRIAREPTDATDEELGQIPDDVDQQIPG